MTHPDPPPLSIPPPGPVLAAAAVVALQALGLLAFAVGVVVSGLGHDASLGAVLGQGAYFVVLALFLAAVAVALIKGRRWGRTPAIVVQILLVAIGMWLAFPSAQLAWGLALIVVAAGTGYLLLSPPAQEWIAKFPSLFGPDVT